VIVPLVVAKLLAGSVADSVTVNAPALVGVTHKSLGRPPSSVAPLRHTTRDPWRIVIDTLETFDSEICTPARVPARTLVVSSAILGGVCRSAPKR
jgi:hypothetical protein